MKTQQLMEQAVAHHLRGELAEAGQIYQRVLAHDPHVADAWNLSGVLAHQCGQKEASVAWISRAIDLRNDAPEYYLNLATALVDSARHEDGLAAANNCLRLDPKHKLALNVRGNALQELDRIDEALESYHRALEVDPTHADTWVNLGRLHCEIGEFEKAESCSRRALQLCPDHPIALNNLGTIARRTNSASAAIEHFEAAMKTQPNSAVILVNLGNAYQKAGRLSDAEQAFERALELAPDSANAWNSAGVFFQAIAEVEHALKCFRIAWQLNPNHVAAGSNYMFGLNLGQVSREDAVAEHLAFGRMLTPPEARNKQFARDRTTTRRLKVGYLSPDFRRHPLVSFVRPILEHHDRDQFEVLCYANVAAPDATTESLRGLADEWRSVFGLSDHELLTQIEADQVDLLVDLAGHTADSRIRVFAHRAAPVQISMLGYLNTTGLPEMDYVVTDAIRDPQAEDNYYSESVARLPSGGCCWLPPAGAPDVTAAPVFARGHVTFGSTHRPNKMTDETLRLWAAVLNRVAGSRLLLFHNDLADSVDLQQRLTDRLTAAGIDRSRFDLAWDADEEYLTAYGEIDILLEAVPWSSGTTALDALWMGVPIPTVCGQQPAGRPTASALQRLELGDLVARSTDEYIDIVAKLAADRARIAALRESLRDRMRTTVCDAVTHVRELETAYRDMWTRWCDAA